MSAGAERIAVRFEPSHGEPGGVSISSHVFSPTLEFPSTPLTIKIPQIAPVELTPGERQTQRNSHATGVTTSGLAAANGIADLPLTSSGADEADVDFSMIAPHARWSPAEHANDPLDELFGYQVSTCDPQVNAWQLPDEIAATREVTLARAFTSVPDLQVEGIQVDDRVALPVIEDPPAAKPADKEVSREPSVNRFVEPAHAVPADHFAPAVLTPPNETSEPATQPVLAESVIPDVVEQPQVDQPEVSVETDRELVPFKPAWEVDNFGFPELCTRAMDILQDHIRDAVNVLVEEALPARPVISVGSWLRGEGRSTVTILLARALSLAGLRVVLVDADFENARLADQLGLSLDGGWDPATAVEADLAECCVFSLEDRFSLMPLHPQSHTDETTARQSLNSMVERLLPHFQVILLDNGPGAAALAQVGTLGRDVKLIVRDARETSVDALERLVQRLRRQHDGPVYVIENFADDTQD